MVGNPRAEVSSTTLSQLAYLSRTYAVNASVRAYSVRVIHSNQSAMIITAFLIFGIDILS